MKRIISILLLIALVFSLSACSVAKKADDTDGQKKTETSEEEILPVIEEKPEKIVVVTDSEGYKTEILLSTEEEIEGFLKLYDQLEIGEIDGMVTTDSYNRITFYQTDDNTVDLSIEGSNLVRNVGGETHYYELVGIDAIWNYVKNNGVSTELDEGGGS